MLDIFIVNYNTSKILPKMFAACEAAAFGIKVSYWVIDNASRDDSVAVLRDNFSFANLIINRENVGFGRANNQLLRHVSADYILLLNTDAFVQPNSFRESVDFMVAHPRCGVLGVRLIGSDGAVQPSCRHFPTPWNVFVQRAGLSRWMPWVRQIDSSDLAPRDPMECDWVPGCFYLVRREVIEKIGLFDPRFFLYFEEVDHCKRVKEAGWKVMYSPHTSVVHLGGESAKSDGGLTAAGRQLSALQVESELLYFRKHYGIFGLALHMLLIAVGDILLALKDVFKFRGLYSARQHFSYTRLAYSTLKATRYAVRSTR